MRSIVAGFEMETGSDEAGAVAVADAIRTLRLSSRLRDEILVHLIREAPNEGVGLLAVDRSAAHAEAVAFFPGENIDASPTRYTMHPRDVMTALDTISAHGWALGAIVHSHLRGPATPSRTDIGEAHYPEAVMLIVSLASLPPEMRGWRLAEADADTVMEPVTIEVIAGKERDSA